MLPRAAPRPRAGACTLESSLRCLRTSDRLVLRGVMKIRKNQPPPGDAGPALQEPASAYPEARMLPRAAPRPRAGACTLESSLRCLRTSDRLVFSGVLHRFVFVGCCSHSGSSRFFEGCLVLGLSQSRAVMPTRFDALLVFRTVLICRKHFE